MKKYSQNCGYR